MRAGVKPDPVTRKGQTLYRVIDETKDDFTPITNRDGNPIDGGGHRREGISHMLANEVNEIIDKRTGKSG